MSNELGNKLTLVFLGRSGCGKGTQAQFVLERLKSQGVFHMETGRFLRELLEKKNVTTELARTKIMEQGGLFPWWFPMYLWLREVIEHGEADKHLVGDGTPRRVAEAKFLDDLFEWHGRSLPVCIYIDISDDEATKRLLDRGRADDNEKAIRGRLQYFPKDVLPVISYYKRHRRLVHIDGSLSPELVWKQIDRRLAKRLGEKWPAA